MKMCTLFLIFLFISDFNLYSQISTSNQIIINKSTVDTTNLISNDYTFKLFSLEASDYGWTSQTSGTTNDISCVHFINENEGWATVQNQGLLHTIDGGDLWSFMNISGWDADFNHVYFFDSCDGWLSGDRTFIRTMWFGDNWEGIQYSSSSRYRNASFPINNSLIWIVGGALEPNCEHFFHRYNFHGDGSAGYYASTYYGHCSTILMDIYMANDSTGWVVGTLGKIWKINKASSQSPEITEQVSGTDLSLNSIFMMNQELGWIVGENGTILKNTDGDSIWLTQNSGVTYNLNSVSFIDMDSGIAVGDSGTIIRTNDGGQTWINEVSGTTKNLKSIFFVNSKIAYAVGQNGTILKYSILPPDIPVLTSPSNNSTNEALALSFYWNSSDRAENYELQISTESDFNTTVVNESEIISASIEIIGLTNSKKYYWRVNASNAGGSSNWSETWNFTTINLVGINEFSLSKNKLYISVFPNPNYGKFRLRFENGKLGKYHVQIINDLGQVQLEKEVYISDNSHEEEFELLYLPRGNYFVIVSDGKATNTKKIILQ